MRVFVIMAAVLFAGVASGQDCANGRCPVPSFGTAVVMPALQPVSYQTAQPSYQPASFYQSVPQHPSAYQSSCGCQPVVERRRPVLNLVRRLVR